MSETYGLSLQFALFLKSKKSYNYLFIAIPYTAIGLSCVGFNILLNLIWNRFWAGGNIFLMANTYYMLVQFFLSILIIWEVTPWMRYIHYVRLFSLISSYVYSIIYIAALIRYFSLILEWDGREPDLDELFLSMVIGYNLILNASIIPINVAIALKEFSMEWFQFNIADTKYASL
jgi:hypothetical protein